ncbi:DUF6786 family protein [Dyadobacter psychrophilus]|uniref:Lipoprotein n=1 Tax=Dyadobacter psychrophilus TaxID=651661 RepID=A0A1T5CN60_9BACT|nr:DUF6786 family protein [Dyadobacter psychrophilus]SKB60877.1 hypothetical protein SAMN05660293_01396 [Dyadobacter psychrophilus]
MQKHLSVSLLILAVFAMNACRSNNQSNQETLEQTNNDAKGTFGYDVAFLKKYNNALTLQAPDNADAQAIIVPEYQGRVMTSTASGTKGNSYGWINYNLIESGVNQPHINAFGGEERFWLSPEGGQFSVYFKKGQTFDFANWQTPAIIDTVTYQAVESDSSSVSFRANAIIENYSGTVFVVEINRKISMLDKAAIMSELNVASLEGCKSVAYESINSLTNKDTDWKAETGMLGIWLLGMFQPTEKTVIVAPFSTRLSKKPLLTDDYFGKIPSDRIAVKDSAVYLRADGKFRSKIGIAPRSARNVAGSYDAEKGILTIIQYDLKAEEKYLKSTWEIHKDPYDGDAFNAYNDGKLADGSQMGPFYELESNSPAKALKEGETLTHRQRTYHFEGSKETLGAISQSVLGVSLDNIAAAFQ